MPPLTEAQTAELHSFFTEIKGGWDEIKSLPATFRTLQDENAQLRQQLSDHRRTSLTRHSTLASRAPGTVSDDLAMAVASTYILHCARHDRLEALCSVSTQRDRIVDIARSTFGMTTRAAVNTSDIPLPTQYGSELRELICSFGVARRRMTPYPIGMGTAKPVRMGTRPAFGSIPMSGAFAEKSPTITFASLESHKVGGLVKLPREIDEQSVLSMGHFLARYGVVEFARLEDNWAFNADGNSPFESVKGIVQVAKDNNRTVVLGAGKTKPSDATLDDFRALRRMVNKAALNGRLSAYYLDTTWETRLSAFKTTAESNVYQRLPDGSAILDGYPIIWTDVLEPYGTVADADKAIAVFGALSFWWMGEHGTPRIDTSDQVFFVNDQLAIRFIEEIDFDYAAVDATAALLTAAS